MADEFSPRKHLFRRYAEVFRAAWRDRDRERASRRYTSAEADFLPQALAVSERPTPIMPHVALWALCLLVLLAALWSMIGKMDVVVVAQGKVLSSGKTKAIQSVESQIVRAIKVKEGQPVAEGDLLIEFDSAAAQADLQRFRADAERASAMAWAYKTLLANLETRTVANPLATQTPPPAEAADLAVETARNRWDEYRAKMERAMAELARRRAEREAVDVTVETLRTRLARQARVEADYRAMIQERAVGRHALLEQELRTLELQLELKNAEAQSRQIDLATRESEAAVALVYATDKALWREKMLEADREASMAGSELSKANVRLAINHLHAPTSGRVQQLTVFAPGAVVTAGQPIMSLVPLGDALEIEALVENRDIGFIRVGQKAEVKLEAFDYTRYGTIPATVTVISADAVADERGVLRYPVQLRLDRAGLEIAGRVAPVAPGMVAYADIKSGRRTILSYVLSPIIKTVEESLRER